MFAFREVVGCLWQPIIILFKIIHFIISFLLFKTPGTSWRIFLTLAALRIVVLSLLFRRYLGPWVLTRISKHIRVRSVSLRSIRGIYVYKTSGGHSQSWTIDRIGWTWSSSASRHLIIKVESVSLQIHSLETPPASTLYHKRSYTFEALGYTREIPGNLLSAMTQSFNHYVRPVMRTLAADWLRRVLTFIPGILSAVALDIQGFRVYYQGEPRLEFSIDKVELSTSLEFSSIEKSARPTTKRTSSRSAKRSNGWGAFKFHVGGGMRRTWDRVAEEKEAKTNISLKLVDIAGTLPSVSSSGSTKFLRLPGSIVVNLTTAFNLRRFNFRTHSLNADAQISNCFVELGPILAVFSAMKTKSEAPSGVSASQYVQPKSPSFLEIPPSPATPMSAVTQGSVSPMSPRSPLMETLSATLRSRRHHYRPHMKLKDTPRKAKLSFLSSFRVQFSSISFAIPSSSASSETCATVVSDLVLSAGLSDPQKDRLHCSWLGRNTFDEPFDSDIYSMSITVDSLSVTRRSLHDRAGILSLKRFNWKVLTTQWPSPFLVTSPFIGGDPNSPALISRLSVGSLDVTEHVDVLMRHIHTHEGASVDDAGTPHNSMLPIPRFIFEAECGSICGALLVGDSQQALELKTDGFVLSSRSYFTPVPGRFRPIGDSFDEARLKLTITSSLSLKSTFLRACHMRSGNPRLSTLVEDPSIVSLEAVEVACSNSMLATIKDDTENIPCVDLSTLESKATCFTEILCVELWHPVAGEVLCKLLQVAQSRPSSRPSAKTTSAIKFNGAVDLSVQRIVVFVTAPDISTNEEGSLSRGVAICTTGLSIQARVLKAETTESDRLYKRNGNYWGERDLLDLPEDPTIRALAHTRVAERTTSPIFVRLTIPRVAVRSAVSTRYSPDDPLIAERDDPALKDLTFLKVNAIEIDLSQKSSTSDISVTASSIHLNFKLAHLYSVLLASRSLNRFSQSRPRTDRVDQPLPSQSFTVTVGIDTAQLHFSLRQEEAACRFDAIRVSLGSQKSLDGRWERSVVWVRVPASVNRWEEGRGHRWEELLATQTWEVQVPLGQKPPSITVAGESARIRIPHGFVLSDLVLEVGVAIKACKHLSHITAIGASAPFPEPEAEGPKSVPKVSLRIGFLCAEAADDPLESKLSLIFRSGPNAAQSRADREEAFLAKVESILGEGVPLVDREVPWRFSSKHSVSIQEARSRLDRVHVLDWIMRLDQVKAEQAEAEEEVRQRFKGVPGSRAYNRVPNLVEVSPISDSPPLFRVAFSDLTLSLDKPSFPLDHLPEFLLSQGQLPKETEYWLLVPIHIKLALSSLKITLRDYPLALAHISSLSDYTDPALVFDTDLVVAEEMGPPSSVDWIDCPVVCGEQSSSDRILTIAVPKTIMPVKTYANAQVNVLTPNISSFSWGVSTAPATHDLMRIVESLTSAPKDPSRPIGFWDKMRLVFHWSLRASFEGEVRYHMKGLRDPYEITDKGAGFVLSWRGNTKLLVGRENESKELIQVISDELYIAIPRLRHFPSQQSAPFTKICAKFVSGVRFGLGFVFERACGPSCTGCRGTPFDRKCRYFHFKPHHQVKLEKKDFIPMLNGPADSYTDFRSDFIHLSISLTSSIRTTKNKTNLASSLHLTPKVFSYFYSWWGLFDGVLSLPIRFGTYFASRNVSPKFGRHLATLKYRIAVPKLHVMHGYIDDSKETWVDGVTPWLGVKAMVDELQVDMHQRDSETVVADPTASSVKARRRKPFYAAELVMKGLDLRAILATFSEPLKADIDISTPPHKSNYRTRTDLPTADHSSPWHDPDDFIETDWRSPPDSEHAQLHILPVASCPRFTYFKKNSAISGDPTQRSKFGDEDTHQCLLGKEPSVPQVQSTLASERVSQLKVHLDRPGAEETKGPQQRKISLLEHYIETLQKLDEDSPTDHSPDYQMPADSVSADEWAEFDNVYQIHAPKLFLDSAIRDIMMQYYYCSRARRGFEYHMATRAVKFIRDQAKAATSTEPTDTSKGYHTAQAAASAIRKMFSGDGVRSSQDRPTVQYVRSSQSSSKALDPMGGWSEGVSLRKSHCCLLLKPQIVLRNRDDEKDICVVTAVQAKLQSYVIMDDSNFDDPISGKVMSRTYAVLSGMQTFAPTSSSGLDIHYVPLEVLIDLRCESEEFERLVPQTDASFQYDKFNRLRLRNNVTSVARRSTESTDTNHLQDQTDLLRVHIPNFTVSANDNHFQTISNIITKLLLFSDAAHKTQIDKLNTLMFTYDFDDLASSADVITDLQQRIRTALDIEHGARNSSRIGDDEVAFELMKLRAHLVSLTEELNLIFEAIKYAQDRHDDQTDRKSALLLNATSSEISWRMLDDQRALLAKFVVQDIDYYWLSKQDSSTVNNLLVGNLQAFDGSRDALWTEIVSKYDEPHNHPLLKRGLFLTSSWIVLPPVGGITIYETFELNFHPLRLQIDARVGTRIMEYLWPARKNRTQAIEDDDENPEQDFAVLPARSSLDSPRPHNMSRQNSGTTTPTGLAPPLRRLGASRSFTDLRSSLTESSRPLSPALHKTRSSEGLRERANTKAPDLLEVGRSKSRAGSLHESSSKTGDAAEMRTRSSQKTFILVRISSLHLVLNVMKEDSFVCQDARIRTRDLEFRNQTWSFEEFVNQFIPSDMSWKSWVKMAFHQPLVPVLPVARELLAKTKWIASKSGTSLPGPEHAAKPTTKLLKAPRKSSNSHMSDDDDTPTASYSASKTDQHTRWKKASRRTREPVQMTDAAFTTEPGPINADDDLDDSASPPQNRRRVLSLFGRRTTSSRSGNSKNERSRSRPANRFR
ncbi:Protein SABRE [Marasmius crinis-equi]|uniref:Protein SABRE n=1 Tax=Marasmius crinis-equi TaxID=585013 RepID=A0ABR3F9X0_9AGAR